MELQMSDIIGNTDNINKFVDSYELNTWYEDSVGNPFIILLDEEGDCFMVFITDLDLLDFNIVSSNEYLMLSVNILHNIIRLVEEYCE